MSSKIIFALLVVVVAVTAIPAQPPANVGWPAAGGGWPAAGGGWPAAGANPWIPPWVASSLWFPQWTPCTVIGSTCLDCSTKLVCTKVGGLQKACTDPTMPYCNLGQCSATPTAECAPPTTETTSNAA